MQQLRSKTCIEVLYLHDYEAVFKITAKSYRDQNVVDRRILVLVWKCLLSLRQVLLRLEFEAGSSQATTMNSEASISLQQMGIVDTHRRSVKIKLLHIQQAMLKQMAAWQKGLAMMTLKMKGQGGSEAGHFHHLICVKSDDGLGGRYKLAGLLELMKWRSWDHDSNRTV